MCLNNMQRVAQRPKDKSLLRSGGVNEVKIGSNRGNLPCPGTNWLKNLLSLAIGRKKNVLKEVNFRLEA
jgi:hypothetical protein